MLMIDFSIDPLGKGESVSKDVSRAVDLIDRSGITYRLGPMSTTIEGDIDQVLDLVKKCLTEMAHSAHRVSFTIRGDWRQGADSRLARKVEKVEKTLHRSLSH